MGRRRQLESGQAIRSIQNKKPAKQDRRGHTRYLIDAYEKEGFKRDTSALRAEGAGRGWDKGRIAFPIYARQELSEGTTASGLWNPESESSSDIRIKEEICERIEAAPNLKSSNIRVKVRDSRVTLNGVLREDHMRGIVDSILNSIDGIQSVENRIRTLSKQKLQVKSRQQSGI